MEQMITHEVFAPYVDQPFTIKVEGETLELMLTEVDVSKANPPLPEMRRAFTLIFKGPKDRVLREGNYEVENNEAGKHQLYLIPIISIGELQSYQSVFN